MLVMTRPGTHLRLARMRRATAALHESELRFRSMADCAPVLMWTCGTDQRCDYFNAGWLDFTGRSKEEEIGRGWTEGIHAGDLQRLLTALDDAFAAKRGFTLEYRLRRHDGQYRWMLGTGAPRFLPGKEFFGYIGASIDIGDFKRAQEEIERLNESLEWRVAERTAQLVGANRQLNAIGSSISHDLRAPLRRIQSIATILAEDHGPQLNESGLKHLGSLRRNAKNMAALIDALLEMGRLEQKEMASMATNLNAVVEGVLTDIRPDLTDRQIEWRIGTLPTLACDPSLMRCVFTNLLSNAVKYTRGREPAVIEIAEAVVGDGMTAIFVRDNGAGFNPKYADKLFVVFQRLHRADEFEGIGVGLATVQRIIEKHGGRIWAEGAVDMGATFFFTLGATARPKKGGL
jgi:PAS domain S-box-containing protein